VIEFATRWDEEVQDYFEESDEAANQDVISSDQEDTEEARFQDSLEDIEVFEDEDSESSDVRRLHHLKKVQFHLTGPV